MILNALLKPEAKNPPKGAMREAKMERGKECRTAGYMLKLRPSNCRYKKFNITWSHK